MDGVIEPLEAEYVALERPVAVNGELVQKLGREVVGLQEFERAALVFAATGS